MSQSVGGAVVRARQRGSDFPSTVHSKKQKVYRDLALYGVACYVRRYPEREVILYTVYGPFTLPREK